QQVAWLHDKEDNNAIILAVHEKVITQNPRISVSQSSHRTWSLHVKDVDRSDAGKYTCQINAGIYINNSGYLKVVVPPEILDSESSSDVIAREGRDVSLRCKAQGSPTPSVYWEREGGQKIFLEKNRQVLRYDGEELTLLGVNRRDMGVYRCVASNDVPPPRSKRIMLTVDFPPNLSIENQLLGAKYGDAVTLECNVEAQPPSINYWIRENVSSIALVLPPNPSSSPVPGETVQSSDRVEIREVKGLLPYQQRMVLRINFVQKNDFGEFRCVARNPSGTTESAIKLYEVVPSTTTSTAPPPTPSTAPTGVAREGDHSLFDRDLQPPSGEYCAGWLGAVALFVAGMWSRSRCQDDSTSLVCGVLLEGPETVEPNTVERPRAIATKSVVSQHEGGGWESAPNPVDNTASSADLREARGERNSPHAPQDTSSEHEGGGWESAPNPVDNTASSADLREARGERNSPHAPQDTSSACSLGLTGTTAGTAFNVVVLLIITIP
ncbi:unnamed protein product, partial [Cyprideis torosa]